MLLLIILQLLFTTVASNAQQPANTSSSTPLCISYEREALLTFKNSFDYFFYSWKNNDCCLWEGVTCDHSSGHVTELHLSGNHIDGFCCTGCCLTGRFPSNSTLFNLRHLRHLDLAFNNFLATPIPSGFGRLSNLEYLNLSYSGFTGQLPREIGWLSQLTMLDFSYLYDVEMSNFKTIIANLTELRELDLTYVKISSNLPPMIANLSKLESLRLQSCNLQGEFQETTILNMPNLRVLDVGYNRNMYCHFSALRWRSPLEFVYFTNNNFSGILPKIIGNSSNFSLRFFNIDSCQFYGETPSWIWNVLEVISVDDNNLSGSIPATVNATKLTRLSAIYFYGNMITGTIPAWLFTLPSLNYLYFDHNLLTGIDQSANFSISSSTLENFSVSNNRLQGSIPESIFGLHNLRVLDLQENNLTGTILLSKLFKLQNMETLILSHNNLFLVDDIGVESSTSFPSLEHLGLSSCNLGHFPSFLKKQEMLFDLDLSNNGIHDVVPKWFLNLSFLRVLDLSYNSLTGSLENLQTQNKKNINMELPSAMSSSLCHLSQLEMLDLSHNNLTGFIPDCFTNFISNEFFFILDLKQNKLQGIIPSIIFENCSSTLNTLSLSGNLLQGPLPESLRNCKGLDLIDVGDNNLNGTFPHWLNIIPELQVLILGSNNLHGSLISSNKTNPFKMLRILDISNNNLTGSLPPTLLASFSAMMEVDDNRLLEYMSDMSLGYDYYEDSIKAWVKGLNRELPKILYSLFLIDVSKNRLEGEIPKEIGDLVNIRWLNLAHNNFTGNIPRSLGNLSLLESLDLSFNKLDGQIPPELANLNSLGFFNVSENNLVGPVPSGRHFDTFLDDSYIGNPRLCGEFLKKRCGERNVPPTSTPAKGSNSRSSSFHVWEIVSMGFGCGFLAGSVWGYFIVWESNYYWVVKLIFKLEVFMIRWPQRRRLQNRRN